MDDQIADVEGALVRRRKALQKTGEAGEDYRKKAQEQLDAAAAADAKGVAIQDDVARLEHQRKELYGRKVPGAGGAGSTLTPGAGVVDALARLLAEVAPAAAGLSEAGQAAVGVLQGLLRQAEVGVPQLPGGGHTVGQSTAGAASAGALALPNGAGLVRLEDFEQFAEDFDMNETDLDFVLSTASEEDRPAVERILATMRRKRASASKATAAVRATIKK